MKQTAVEWLAKELYEKMEMKGDGEVFDKILEQAKEIEKQQIGEACNQTEFEDIDGMGIHETITKGEQYYAEIFEK